uniref:CSON004451 protein n=1 Tax=Culicoides sonorensis TaxID=179676 RepID=A0A336KC01_CULSO
MKPCEANVRKQIPPIGRPSLINATFAASSRGAFTGNTISVLFMLLLSLILLSALIMTSSERSSLSSRLMRLFASTPFLDEDGPIASLFRFL